MKLGKLGHACENFPRNASKLGANLFSKSKFSVNISYRQCYVLSTDATHTFSSDSVKVPLLRARAYCDSAWLLAAHGCRLECTWVPIINRCALTTSNRSSLLCLVQLGKTSERSILFVSSIGMLARHIHSVILGEINIPNDLPTVWWHWGSP